MTLGRSSSNVDDLKVLADALVTAVRELKAKYCTARSEAGNANMSIYQVLQDTGPVIPMC